MIADAVVPLDASAEPVQPSAKAQPVAHSNQSPWLTVNEAAERAKCGDRLLRREINAGRLRAARLGLRRDIRLHVDWVDAWLRASAEIVEVRRAR
jgi:excisionase family DNA binding protein